MPHAAPVTAFPKGSMQTGFRDGGGRRAPDAGPDPSDLADYLSVFRRPDLPGGPERTLMAAVLRDAIDTFRKYRDARDPRGQQLAADAHAWIVADDEGWAFSFVRICEMLGVAASTLRRRVLEDRPEERPATPLHRAASASRTPIVA